MNKTISIYMRPDGDFALVVIRCHLYKGSYKDKQINLYVPKSIPYQLEESTNILNTVSIAARLVTEQGVNSTTIPYYPDYVGDEIVSIDNQNVECSVYTLQMPNTFTAFVGTQTMVANIVTIDNTDPTSPLVLQIVASQSATYVVNPSAVIDDPEIDADIVAQLMGQVQAVEEDLDAKQDKQDNNLVAIPNTPKKVVDSINHTYNLASTNADAIATNSASINELNLAVEELQAKLAGAEIPVGSMSGTTMPTNTQLTAYTVAQTGEQPEPNNVIIFTLEVEGGTDRVFKYIYVSADYGWTYYEIPAIEHANNGTYGSIQGTHEINSTNDMLADIRDGELRDIYYKDNDGVYQNLRTQIKSVVGVTEGIFDSDNPLVVAKATQAVQDQLGNVINTTYAQASTVYTKTESDAKYLAKTYTNVYYYATSGLVDDVPNTPASGIQFTETVDTVGETLICDCSRTTTGDYHFTKNSSDHSSIVLATDVACSLQFRLETYANDTVLAADLSDVLTFAANTPQTLDITSIYSGLGTTEIDVPAGSTISKKLYAISTDTTEKNVYLYSNATYPSTYQLNAQSIVLTVNTINGLKAVPIAQSEWTDNGDDTYTVTIAQTRHQQPASTKYFLELQKQVTANSYQYIAFTPIVDDAGNITITTNEAIDCILLIGSNLSTDEKGIITITNPTVAQEIDYNLYGAMKVTQTTQPVALNLLPPTDTSKFYAFFITNDTNSTETINWNGEDIAPGSGLQFRWDGAQWIVGEQPTSTTEIYDDANDQLLSTTITQLENGISTNANNITTLQNTKQNTLTFDPAPTDTSTNPVTSGGVYTALSSKEDTTNKVTSMSNSSTNTQYPGAKCVYDAINNRNPSTTINATWTTSSSTIDQILNVGGVTTMNTLTLASAYTFTAGHFYTIQIQAVTQLGNVTVSQANGIYTAPFNVQGQPFLGVDADNANPSSFCTMSFSGTTFKIACGRNIKSGYTENFKVIIKDYT